MGKIQTSKGCLKCGTALYHYYEGDLFRFENTIDKYECPKCGKVYHESDFGSESIKLKDLLQKLDPNSYIEIYAGGDGPYYYGKVKEYKISYIDYIKNQDNYIEHPVIYRENTEINMYDETKQDLKLCRFYTHTVRGKGTLAFFDYGGND